MQKYTLYYCITGTGTSAVLTFIFVVQESGKNCNTVDHD